MKHTIVIKRGRILYKVAKLIFGNDGSYYITVPYHKANKAQLMKARVDYDDAGLFQQISTTDLVDLGSADNDRIKLSHHPDGFVQFSGQGLLSGRNPDGSPKGIGVLSMPLGKKFNGPAFGLGLPTLNEFPIITEPPKDMFLLDADGIYATPGCSALQLEAHYFPPLWHRFIRRSSRLTLDTILIGHPSTAVVELLVLRMPEACTIPGFFGFELSTMPISDADMAADKIDYPQFSLNGPSGKIRIEKNGHRVADALFCAYPRGSIKDTFLGRGRNLNFARPKEPSGCASERHEDPPS